MYIANNQDVSKNPLLERFLKYPYTLNAQEIHTLLLHSTPLNIKSSYFKISDFPKTLFHYLCYWGYTECLYILEKNISIHLLKQYIAMGNHSGLTLAMDRGHLSIIEFLTERMEPDRIISMMYEANHHRLHLAAEGGHFSLIKYLFDFLLEKEMLTFENRRHIISEHQFALFQTAVRGGNLELIYYFVASVPPNDVESMICSMNNASIATAICIGHVELLKYLLSKVPTNTLSQVMAEEFDRFRVAVFWGHTSMLHFLLNEASLKNKIRQLIIKNNYDNFSLCMAKGYLSVFKMLLQCLDVEEQHYLFKTKRFNLFYNAVFHGQLVMLRFLFDQIKSKEEQLKLISRKEYSGLQAAADREQLSIFRFLLNKIDSQDILWDMIRADNCRVFLYLVEHGHLFMIQFLLEKVHLLNNAEEKQFSIISTLNFKAFYTAAIKEHWSILSYLISLLKPGALKNYPWNHFHSERYFKPYDEPGYVKAFILAANHGLYSICDQLLHHNRYLLNFLNYYNTPDLEGISQNRYHACLIQYYLLTIIKEPMLVKKIMDLADYWSPLHTSMRTINYISENPFHFAHHRLVQIQNRIKIDEMVCLSKNSLFKPNYFLFEVLLKQLNKINSLKQPDYRKQEKALFVINRNLGNVALGSKRDVQFELSAKFRESLNEHRYQMSIIHYILSALITEKALVNFILKKANYSQSFKPTAEILVKKPWSPIQISLSGINVAMKKIPKKKETSLSKEDKKSHGFFHRMIQVKQQFKKSKYEQNNLTLFSSVNRGEPREAGKSNHQLRSSGPN